MNWESDLDLAKNLAAKEGKLVLLHFSAEWCRPCKQLKTFVFSSPTVIGSINERCVPVLLDTDENPELVKQYDVTAIPLDIIITPAGRVLQKRQSPKDATNYVRMLEVVDGYDTQYAQRKAVITEKIGEVLQEIEQGNKSKISQENDFVAQAPQNKAPEPAGEGQRLLAQSKNRLVDHIASDAAAAKITTTSNQTEVAEPVDTSSSPQRVFNDRFFVEKSHNPQARTNAAELNNTPSVPKRIEGFVDNTMQSGNSQLQKTAAQLEEERVQMAIPSQGEFVPQVAPKRASNLKVTKQSVSKFEKTVEPAPSMSVPKTADASRAKAVAKFQQVPGTVSYTHLTLPTICSV